MSFTSVKLVLAALSLVQHVVAAPTRADAAVIVKRQAELRDEYDFIVAGAGTAGLTVADRLSEGGQYTVLVVEYGYLDGSHSITATGPDAQQAGAIDYPSGTRIVVGGSSAVNGMFFDRGSADDYDAWVRCAGDEADEYAREWGWDNIYPFFQKSVTFHPPSEKMQEEYGMTYDMAAYGGDTPIHSSYAPFQWPTTVGIWKAWETIEGVEFPKEHADGNATGVFCNAANKRANFHLLPAHRVTKVGLEEVEGDDAHSHRATGVYIAPRDGDLWKSGPVFIKAKREVVVSSGAVHTPQVLQRSGIGHREVLEAAGVEVKVELPGVGFNLQDHSHYSISFNFTTNLTPNPNDLGTDAEFTQQALEQWREDKSGPHSANVNAGAFLPLSFVSDRSAEILDAWLAQDAAEFLPENTHPTVIAGYEQQRKVQAEMFDAKNSAELEWLFSGRSSFSIITIKITSRGTILLSPEDDGDAQGHVEPVVDWRTWSNPIDAEMNVEWLKFARWFMQSDAMQDTFGPVEISPAPPPSNGHLIGTAALGPKSLGGVVGPDLLVHGVLGLSVADNSIMTTIVGAHTSSSAYAIGEKAADTILRRAKKNETPVEEEPVEEEPVEEEPVEEEPVEEEPVEEEPVEEEPVEEEPVEEAPVEEEPVEDDTEKPAPPPKDEP
ncbi:unnamed protein product [Parascedosporium putredinis]|uniref:Glucose-methanol-choline oxidoreductase N-terminal domain-containing protein n=1 Tax=Parascedosporium putredinis TaxID=1442378 RepID=A0A9P1GVQ3_9PEZI|nr:unnamed protein product [Parascedosporium putredinis]CAI7988232.1 unnamed protein product [Parascedosporium putredinis]